MSKTSDTLPRHSRQALVRRQMAAQRVLNSKSYDFWKLIAMHYLLAKMLVPFRNIALSLSGFNCWELAALTLGRHEGTSFIGRCLTYIGICREGVEAGNSFVVE